MDREEMKGREYGCKWQGRMLERSVWDGYERVWGEGAEGRCRVENLKV
jgi:hypothetical protein